MKVEAPSPWHCLKLLSCWKLVLAPQRPAAPLQWNPLVALGSDPKWLPVVPELAAAPPRQRLAGSVPLRRQTSLTEAMRPGCSTTIHERVRVERHEEDQDETREPSKRDSQQNLHRHLPSIGSCLPLSASNKQQVTQQLWSTTDITSWNFCT